MHQVRWWRKVVELRLEPDMEKGKMLDGWVDDSSVGEMLV